MTAPMLLGLLSDSHGRVEPTRAAVKALLDAGADTLIYLGDVGSDEVLEELVSAPTMVVFGNCDDEQALARHAERLGLRVCHPAGRLECGGKHIAFTHGHLQNHLRAALEDGVDYLLHGHTHEVCNEVVGRTRIINPGALCRARRYTAALLDPAADRVEFLEIAQ